MVNNEVKNIKPDMHRFRECDTSALFSSTHNATVVTSKMQDMRLFLEDKPIYPLEGIFCL